MSDDLTLVFRITASLREPVKYAVIREAVEITSKRFPYFSVSLGTGIFWHFLEFNDQLPRIQSEENIPCTAFAVKSRNEPLYRILVRGCRISVEFLHLLTDGSGALEYLRSLIYTYRSLSGKDVIDPGDIILPGSEISLEEIEDGYNMYFRKLPPPAKPAKAWHLPFRLNEKPRLRVLHAELKVDEMLELSRKYKVSVTEYFVSVCHFALQQIYISGNDKAGTCRNRVLRIEVPVNMRTKYPSRTMRNFSLYVLPEIDLRLGIYTFEEIVKSVYHQFQISTDTKQISRFLSSNVSYERQLFVRILPLFVKKMAISAIYRGIASKRLTAVITNLGLVSLPPGMEDLVDFFEIVPPPPNTAVKMSIGIVSYKDRMRISFCNITQSRELERLVLRHLAKAGLSVRILNEF